jgi:hypothetical protein
MRPLRLRRWRRMAPPSEIHVGVSISTATTFLLDCFTPTKRPGKGNLPRTWQVLWSPRFQMSTAALTERLAEAETFSRLPLDICSSRFAANQSRQSNCPGSFASLWIESELAVCRAYMERVPYSIATGTFSGIVLLGEKPGRALSTPDSPRSIAVDKPHTTAAQRDRWASFTSVSISPTMSRTIAPTSATFGQVPVQPIFSRTSGDGQFQRHFSH